MPDLRNLTDLVNLKLIDLKFTKSQKFCKLIQINEFEIYL